MMLSFMLVSFFNECERHACTSHKIPDSISEFGTNKCSLQHFPVHLHVVILITVPLIR